jgi:multidrug efflux system membrane fusion protein
VLVVNAKNQVRWRQVRIGLEHDGLREVKEGLRQGEWVVRDGLQKLYEGMTIRPKKPTVSDARE